MSVKIQLLAASELAEGQSYRRFYTSNEMGAPFVFDLSKEKLRCDYGRVLGYVATDDIHFNAPDPDKGLIEGWVKSVISNFDEVAIPKGEPNPLGSVWRLSAFGARDIARSFLDYQRKQEGKR